MKQKVSKKFEELYGKGAELFTSPGRINLIGEHTDYNGGFVFPGAVDKGIVAAIRLNGTDKVNAYALDLGEQSSFGLNEEDKPKEGWACYIFGVCREIQKRGGKIGGFDTVFSGVCAPWCWYVFVCGAGIDLCFCTERALPLWHRQIRTGADRPVDRT